MTKAAVCLIVCATVSCFCASDVRAEETRPDQRRDEQSGAHIALILGLLGPVETLEGQPWPRGRNPITGAENELAIACRVEEPHRVRMSLPGGQVLETASGLTILEQSRGSLVSVRVLPHTQPLHFQQAIAMIEDVCKKWDVDTGDDFGRKLETWRAEGDARAWFGAIRRRAGAALRGEPTSLVHFTIRSTDEGFFVTTLVSATMEERKRIREAADATTRPAE